jgi:hypothetical protein
MLINVLSDPESHKNIHESRHYLLSIILIIDYSRCFLQNNFKMILYLYTFLAIKSKFLLSLHLTI